MTIGNLLDFRRTNRVRFGFVLALLLLGSAATAGDEANAAFLEELTIAAELVREGLPVRVDEDTTLSDVVVDQTGLVYLYEITADEVGTAAVWKEQLHARADEIRRDNCTNPVVVAVLDAGYSVRYHYALYGDPIWVNALRGDACKTEREVRDVET